MWRIEYCRITFKRIIVNRSTEKFSGIPYVMTLLNCLLSAWWAFSFTCIFFFTLLPLPSKLCVKLSHMTCYFLSIFVWWLMLYFVQLSLFLLHLGVVNFLWTDNTLGSKSCELTEHVCWLNVRGKNALSSK